MDRYKEMAKGTYRGFLNDDPVYLYIIKSGHKHRSDTEDSRVYYVIEEDPHEPGETFQLTKAEIKAKYNIEL